MRKTAIRLATALGVLLLLACGALALSSGDSLISLSYLKSTFLTDAVAKGEAAAGAKLQETYDAAKSTLDALQKVYLGQSAGTSGNYSGSLQPRMWGEGDRLELYTGSGVLMLAGTATVTHNGAFIDVTAGAEVASGAKLSANHRYLAGEDTTAQLTVRSGAAHLGVLGA